MSPKVVDKEEKRDKILMAAIREFARKGLAKTTINDIAQAAGIGKGTVYEYFANKDEVVFHSFHFFMRSVEPDMESILIAKVSSRVKLERLFDSFNHFLDTHNRELMELMFDFWSEGIRSTHSKGILLEHMRKFYKVYREVFADVIIEGMGDGSFRKDINPDRAASMIVGCLDGLMVQWILDKENLDFPGILRTISNVMLNGLIQK